MTKPSTNATQNDLNQLGQYGDLYSLFTKSKGNTSTVTETTGSTLRSGDVQAYIDGILGGTSGLASVQAGQKGAGLYSGSTNRLLTSRLTSDVAAKTAVAGAGNTVTRTTNTGGGGNANRNMALAMMAGKQLFAKPAKKAGEEVGTSLAQDAVSYVSSLFAPSVASGSMSMGADAVSGGTDLGIGMTLAPVATGWLDQWAGDTAKNTATDAAASESGGGFLDWIGGLFGGWAEGGRVPKKAWADGGRVSGLRSANIGALPTMTKLGQYSYAGGPGTSSSAGGPPDAGEVDSIGSVTGQYTPSQVTSADLAARTGPGMFDGFLTKTIGDLLDVDYATVSQGLNTLGRGIVGTALGVMSPMGLAPGLGTVGNQLVTTVGRKSLTDQIFDTPIQDTFQALNRDRNTPEMEAIYGKGQTALDTGTAAGIARGMEAEHNLVEQERALTTSQAIAEYLAAQEQAGTDDDDPGNQGHAGFGPDTTAEEADAMSTANAAADGNDWAKGGRVRGDSNHGVDDVPVKLGPDAGGGIGMLDGGEVVLKSSSTAKIDNALGARFLDELNKNPERFIKFMLSGARG